VGKINLTLPAGGNLRGNPLEVHKTFVLPALDLMCARPLCSETVKAGFRFQQLCWKFVCPPIFEK